MLLAVLDVGAGADDGLIALIQTNGVVNSVLTVAGLITGAAGDALHELATVLIMTYILRPS